MKLGLQRLILLPLSWVVRVVQTWGLTLLTDLGSLMRVLKRMSSHVLYVVYLQKLVLISYPVHSYPTFATQATLQWIRIERPDWLCLQILEMNGPYTRVPTRTAREAPNSGPPGPSREFRPSPRTGVKNLRLPAAKHSTHRSSNFSWKFFWFNKEEGKNCFRATVSLQEILESLHES